MTESAGMPQKSTSIEADSDLIPADVDPDDEDEAFDLDEVMRSLESES